MSKSCSVEFDGACEGGAGAVIRNSSGDVVARLHKPLSYTTNNRAEYEMGSDDNDAIGHSQEDDTDDTEADADRASDK